ncbi:MAG TPA: RDD family protein [Caulobacteraceae bacterium]|jgi:uncharacterized RDD family membrane protein YckC
MTDARLTPRRRTFVTPEGVDLGVEVATGGERASAFLIDAAIIVGVLILFSILAAFGAGVAGLGGPRAGAEIALVIWLLGAFLLRNGYFILFELTARAATPGKRIVGLRVAARNGGRLTAEAVFVRNAMREIEVFLPLSVIFGQGAGQGGVDAWMYLAAFVWCSIFAFLPLFNRDRLRVGDLVGGTWVVNAPRRKLLADLSEGGAERLARFAFTTAQLDAYGVKELQVLEDVLRARDKRVMKDVADRIRNKIGWAARPEESDPDFLGAYYAGLRGRLEARLLMGRRRRDKHDVG